MTLFFNSSPAGALPLPRLKRNPDDLPGKYAWRIICLFTLLVLECMTLPVQADGFEVQDSLGRFIERSQPPGKIVSLVPSASEILVEIQNS
ncbi:MAG: hypothetical protein U9P10_08335 [Thermodesulfobacteriota bacterium]|nr:hypothetical protein [Thermodesulfobacteriota bacterium]